MDTLEKQNSRNGRQSSEQGDLIKDEKRRQKHSVRVLARNISLK